MRMMTLAIFMLPFGALAGVNVAMTNGGALVSAQHFLCGGRGSFPDPSLIERLDVRDPIRGVGQILIQTGPALRQRPSLPPRLGQPVPTCQSMGTVYTERLIPSAALKDGFTYQVIVNGIQTQLLQVSAGPEMIAICERMAGGNTGLDYLSVYRDPANPLAGWLKLIAVNPKWSAMYPANLRTLKDGVGILVETEGLPLLRLLKSASLIRTPWSGDVWGCRAF